jgi:hypothetical protein
MSHAWVAECEDCNWLGGDHPSDEDEAKKDAELHERGERRAWEPETVVLWTPGRHSVQSPSQLEPFSGGNQT